MINNSIADHSHQIPLCAFCSTEELPHCSHNCETAALGLDGASASSVVEIAWTSLCRFVFVSVILVKDVPLEKLFEVVFQVYAIGGVWVDVAVVHRVLRKDWVRIRRRFPVAVEGGGWR